MGSNWRFEIGFRGYYSLYLYSVDYTDQVKSSFLSLLPTPYSLLPTP
ncbi:MULTISPECIES: hypothetical protein [unclassified Moorena]|nr:MULTISPECIES: hypothetical protein [unclassified Moorena]NEO14862.1 hypothetical protein [Moorena sp. SIO3E8]NEQ01295.1 hypothetical protein [Moorena sp. SIO3F7]